MRKLDPVLLNHRCLSCKQIARQSTGSADNFTSTFAQQVRPNASVPSIYVPASLVMRILERRNLDLSRSHLLTTE